MTTDIASELREIRVIEKKLHEEFETLRAENAILRAENEIMRDALRYLIPARGQISELVSNYAQSVLNELERDK